MSKFDRWLTNEERVRASGEEMNCVRCGETFSVKEYFSTVCPECAIDEPDDSLAYSEEREMDDDGV